MINNICRWLENVWNLRLIFDKYIPQIKELVETIKQLQHQIAELKRLKEELENSRFELLKKKQKNE